MDYIIVSYYLTILHSLLYTSSFLSFSSLYHLRQTPCSFSHYVRLCSFPCRLVLAFCRKCQHVLTQTGCRAVPFFFFFQAKAWLSCGRAFSHKDHHESSRRPLYVSTCSKPNPPPTHTNTLRWRRTLIEVHNV